MNLAGLKRLDNELEKIANTGGGKKNSPPIPNFVMNISAGNGQSYIAEYVATFLKDNKLRRFCGLDLYLEFTLDGKNTERVFEEIADSAVYVNEYEGIVAIDVSGLYEFANEYQVDYFVDHIKRVSKNATVIIYYNEELGNRMEGVVNQICKALGKYIEIHVQYSISDYVEIAVQNIKEKGIDLDKEAITLLNYVMEERQVGCIKDAIDVAEELVLYSDCGKDRRIIGNNAMKYFVSKIL